jgi:hypothetical protein
MTFHEAGGLPVIELLHIPVQMFSTLCRLQVNSTNAPVFDRSYAHVLILVYSANYVITHRSFEG